MVANSKKVMDDGGDGDELQFLISHVSDDELMVYFDGRGSGDGHELCLFYCVAGEELTVYAGKGNGGGDGGDTISDHNSVHT